MLFKVLIKGTNQASQTWLAILGLLSKNAKIEGAIFFNDINLKSISEYLAFLDIYSLCERFISIQISFDLGEAFSINQVVCPLYTPDSITNLGFSFLTI